MPVAETGDGAITNLVRDERSTKRKTAGVASSVCHLPGSLREVAMETNQAVKQWKEAIEPLVLQALKLEGREQRSIDTEASKCAMKAQILAAWLSVALPIAPTHSPDMYGWVAMKTPKVDTAGLRIYTGKYEPDEDDEQENSKRARTEYDNHFFDLALDAAEAELEAAAEAASVEALDFINSGASWDNSDTSTRYHRLTDAQRPNPPFKAPRRTDSAAVVASVLEKLVADVELEAGAVSGGNAEPMTGFQKRVERLSGAAHPERAALKGSSMYAHQIRDPTFSTLCSKLLELRPRRSPRPLEVKMTNTSAVFHQRVPSPSETKLRMPSSETLVDKAKGLGGSLLPPPTELWTPTMSMTPSVKLKFSRGGGGARAAVRAARGGEGGGGGGGEGGGINDADRGDGGSGVGGGGCGVLRCWRHWRHSIR